MSRIHTDDNGVYVNAINDTNDADSGSGHHYQIGWGNDDIHINFQKGAVKENGVNGVTTESLLATSLHRTQQLNKRFPCRENAIAITKMEEALLWLNKRTTDRQERGVEGKEEA